MDQSTNYLNPDSLFHSPAFSQVVTTQGPGKTIYVGGQNAIDAKGDLVGKSDLPKQVAEVMRNIQSALAAASAGFDHLVKLTVYLVAGQDAQAGFAAAKEFMQEVRYQPAVTVVMVAALGHPDYLVEIEAIAFVPAG